VLRPPDENLIREAGHLKRIAAPDDRVGYPAVGSGVPKLLSTPKIRAGFTGSALDAWLRSIPQAMALPADCVRPRAL
jgi:hypothetical protein